MFRFWKGKVPLICLVLSILITTCIFYNVDRALSKQDKSVGIPLCIFSITVMLRALALLLGLDKIVLWHNLLKKASSHLKGMFLISPESSYVDIYTSIRNAFKEVAKCVSDSYLEIYEMYGNIDHFISHGYTDGQNLIKAILHKNVEHLFTDTFKIDDESMVSLYDSYSEGLPIFKSSCEEIEEICSGINKKAENHIYSIEAQRERNKAYRIARKESRARWVGYGFGLSGAIKATLQANVLNSTSGLAHDAYNSIGDTFDAIRLGGKSLFHSTVAGMEKMQIYKNQSTRNMLHNSIYNQVFFFHYAIWSILQAHGKVGDIPIIKGVNEAELREFIAYFDED